MAHDAAVDAHYRTALALQRAGHLEESRNAYLTLVGTGKMLDIALHDLGYLAYAQDDFVKAEAYFAAAHAINPASVSAMTNLAATCKQLGKHQACLDASEKILLIEPDNPAALNCKGSALLGMHRYDEALPVFRRVVEIAPEFIEGHANLASTLKALNRIEEALPVFQRIYAAKPDYALGNFNYATALLKLGDYLRGFEMFEWRWKSVLAIGVRDFGKPLWLGDMPLDGRTILLHQEQGIGDAIQFCRYVPMVAELGANVILRVDDSLVRLLAGRWPRVRVIGKGEPWPDDFDCHSPLMSLPLAFKTELRTVPFSQSYLQADPGISAVWAERIGARKKPRIGLVWSGRAEYTVDALRSIRLADLPELDMNRYEVFSLQKEVRDIDAAELARRGYQHAGALLADFADTAALVSAMDLVISVDTAVAHLAAALGKPVWMLLSTNSDWRWLCDREDSPWYATVRLFRQKHQGDWGDVFLRVREALSVGI